MNIIFCDIDGVFKGVTTPSENSLGGSLLYPVEFKKETFNLNQESIELIKELSFRYDYKIVITSCWRVHSTINHFHTMFLLYDWDTTKVIIDFTPVGHNGFRGEDIDNWTKYRYNNKVHKYIIIDDDDDLTEEQKPMLIKTDSVVGFNLNNFNNAVNLMEAQMYA